MSERAEAILERITAVFREVLDAPGLELAPSTTAADVPGWDSLAHVDLIYGVEQAFGVRFTTREVVSLANVGALAELVRRKSAG